MFDKLLGDLFHQCNAMKELASEQFASKEKKSQKEIIFIQFVTAKDLELMILRLGSIRLIIHQVSMVIVLKNILNLQQGNRTVSRDLRQKEKQVIKTN